MKHTYIVVLSLIVTMVSAQTKTPAIEQDHNWHLMTRTYGGTVSLISHLTHHEALFMRARLLGLPATPAEEKAEEERQKLADPPCPDGWPDRKVNDAEWKAWDKAHPGATGCGFPSGGTSWGGGHSIAAGDIISAEVFR